MGQRPITLRQAPKLYPHRYTTEHIPTWARKPIQLNGQTRYYAPQYTTDKEWYNNTKFPGEAGIPIKCPYCYSTNHTFPMGVWLTEPYSHNCPTTSPIYTQPYAQTT